ncbi:MAG: MFS transporter [Pseudomonadales bacterium]
MHTWRHPLLPTIALSLCPVSSPLGLGRRHPFMYLSAVPLAVAFVGLFSPPDSMGQFGLFAWLTMVAILTRGAMALCHVPHLALGV